MLECSGAAANVAPDSSCRGGKVHVRVESLVLSVNHLFLAAAYAFFALLSIRRLYPATIKNRVGAYVALAAVSCAGIAGTLLYGVPALVADRPATGLPPSDLELAFGSFRVTANACLNLVLK